MKIDRYSFRAQKLENSDKIETQTETLTQLEKWEKGESVLLQLHSSTDSLNKRIAHRIPNAIEYTKYRMRHQQQLNNANNEKSIKFMLVLLYIRAQQAKCA